MRCLFTDYPRAGTIVKRVENKITAEDLSTEPVTGVKLPAGLMAFARDLFYTALLSSETIIHREGEHVIMRQPPMLREDEEIVVHLSRKSYREEESGVDKVMYRAQFWFPQGREPKVLEEAK